MNDKELIFGILYFVLLCVIKIEGQKTSDPFYLIAHMANSRLAIDWAVANGANGIENDLHFNDNGEVTFFEHGSPCDCTCAPASLNDHICKQVLDYQCKGAAAKDGGASHLQHIARFESIALLFIDSKVDANWGSRLSRAGKNVVDFMDQHLFGNGYKGKVVIGSGKINTYDYIQAAVIAANSSPNRERYFFTFDQEADDFRGVTAMLSRLTNNRVYGTGISSCAATTYYAGIKSAVDGKNNRETGLIYIWTIDKESSMENYINRGVQGIMTNRVELAKRKIDSMGLRLAKPSDTIPISTTSISSPDKCDCDYHKGGCTISWPAPSGKACKCKYKLFWTCSGSLVPCDSNHAKCKNPDESKEACQLGRGDCDGY